MLDLYPLACWVQRVGDRLAAHTVPGREAGERVEKRDVIREAVQDLIFLSIDDEPDVAALADQALAQLDGTEK